MLSHATLQACADELMLIKMANPRIGKMISESLAQGAKKGKSALGGHSYGGIKDVVKKPAAQRFKSLGGKGGGTVDWAGH